MYSKPDEINSKELRDLEDLQELLASEQDKQQGKTELDLLKSLGY